MMRRQFIAGIPLLAASPVAAAPKVNRWTIITIGNLSRNSYWGEANTKAYRAVLCTCTLITGDGFQLLVDPSEPSAADMARELDRRTALKLDDITAVFITHDHADHTAGLEHFPKAAWFASAETAAILNAGKFSRKIEPAPDKFFGAVDVIPTPGHTKGHSSLRFDCDNKSIVAAGDSVATLDFWRDRRSFYNAVDPAQGARTMDKIASIANFVIPGHDNYFAV